MRAECRLPSANGKACLLMPQPVECLNVRYCRELSFGPPLQNGSNVSEAVVALAGVTNLRMAAFGNRLDDRL
jgi:hypothetical protein